MQKKIIIINQSSGYLMVDVANALSTSFERVVVFTGGKEISRQQVYKNVALSSLIKYNKKTSLTRASTWILATIQAYFKILLYPKHELLLVSNPPTVPLLGLFLKRRFSILVYDIYPNALENIGVYPKHWIYRFWSSCNKQLYKKATAVLTISEGMKHVIAETCDAEKISVIHTWSSVEKFTKIPKEKNLFVAKNALQNKFIVLYSGNIGFTHQVDTIVDIAENLKHEKDITFVFVGDGMRKQALIEKVAELNLESVLFLPFVPLSELPYSLSAVDISVITLNDKTGLLSVPSKTCNCLAVGSPLLCIAPIDSELNRITEQYGVGKCFEKDNIKEMVEFILQLKNNPTIKQEYASRAIEASRYFTKANAEQFVDILSK